MVFLKRIKAGKVDRPVCSEQSIDSGKNGSSPRYRTDQADRAERSKGVFGRLVQAGVTNSKTEKSHRRWYFPQDRVKHMVLVLREIFTQEKFRVSADQKVLAAVFKS